MTQPKIQSTSTCVAARFSSLPELLGLLSSGMGRAAGNSDHKVLLRASLAIEELFANSIHHGYGRESDAMVWLKVEVDAFLLRVTYEDAAAEFDPLTDLPDPVSTTGTDAHRIGGVGRLLIKNTARRCTYRRQAGRNVVTLEYDLSPPV